MGRSWEAANEETEQEKRKMRRKRRGRRDKRRIKRRRRRRRRRYAGKDILRQNSCPFVPSVYCKDQHKLDIHMM